MTIDDGIGQYASKDKEAYTQIFKELAEYELRYKVHIHLTLNKKTYKIDVWIEGRLWDSVDGIIFTVEKLHLLKLLKRRMLRKALNSYKEAVPKNVK